LEFGDRFGLDSLLTMLDALFRDTADSRAIVRPPPGIAREGLRDDDQRNATESF
jgi:hypothetical protein